MKWYFEVTETAASRSLDAATASLRIRHHIVLQQHSDNIKMSTFVDDCDD